MIVNLAAGLDARAYRMQLPKTLKWIDVDLPGMINYKNEILQNEKPKCEYRSIASILQTEKQDLNYFTIK
jgi:O-Methyltransferase involved in polyketide biosynthesis